MKLLLDQGLPRGAATLLRTKGVDAAHVGDIGMCAASDSAILQTAREQDRIVVTLDADFHTHMALDRAVAPSVIRIRMEGLKAADCAGLILYVLERCRDELAHGCAVSVEDGSIRVRRLPLGGND